jgi:alkylresorcinol/alkylpyrone synthase
VGLVAVCRPDCSSTATKGAIDPACEDAHVPYIAAVSAALGPHRYGQAEITEAFGRLVLGEGANSQSSQNLLLNRVHEATGVQHRHLALPLPEYERLKDFDSANSAFVSVGTSLAADAVAAALEQVGLAGADVDLIVSATVTGVAAPSLDARLVPLVRLRDDVKRLPIFGLGCVAGAAGVARVADYLRGHPDDVAVLVAVELCSLTVQRDDTSIANIVGSGLFGDGAAAVVMVGERRAQSMRLRGPRVRASRSVFYPDTERVMGWDVGGSGFRIVLAPTVADLVTHHLGADVKAFLGDNQLDRADVAHWIAHPGGPKVLEAMQAALDVPRAALQLTWNSLRDVGNLSSVSVLHVLQETLRTQPTGNGEPAVLLAMGPGFCAELVLLEW